MENQKINVVHFVEELGLGCTAKTAVNFCLGIKLMNYNVEVWSLSDGVRSKELTDGGIELKIMSQSDFLLMRKDDIDIFHFHGSGLPNQWLLDLLKSFLPQTKIVQTNIFGGFCDKMHDLIDLKLFVSEATLVKYEMFGGLLNKNYNVLYNPVQDDINISSNVKNYSDKLIIGRIARPDILKWDLEFELLLKLLKNSTNDFKLVIVGVPPEIKQNLVSLNIDIEFIDKIVHKSDLTSFYSSIDVLVHLSSIGESFGCIFVEAMNYGVPVVVKSTPINRFKFWRDNAQVEVVENNVTGYVCDNILSMRDAILLLFNNNFSSGSIIENNKLKFSIKNVINKLDKLYNGLIINNNIQINFDDIKKMYFEREKNIFKTPIVSFYHYYKYTLELMSISLSIKILKLKRNFNNFL